MNLDNPSWQGIGVLISVIGIIVATIISGVIYWLQKPKRKISYYISECQPLLAGGVDAKHDIQVFSNGDKLVNPQLVTIRIQNSGRNEIEKTDFSEPIQIHFGEHARLHSSSISSTTPEGFNVDLSNKQTSIKIEPLLLNRGDAFDIQCLITNMDEIPGISARIKGISKLTRITREEYFGFNVMLFKYHILFGASLALTIGIVSNHLYSRIVLILNTLNK